MNFQYWAVKVAAFYENPLPAAMMKKKTSRGRGERESASRLFDVVIPLTPMHAAAHPSTRRIKFHSSPKGETKKARKSVQLHFRWVVTGLHVILIASLVCFFFWCVDSIIVKTESHKNFLHLSSYMGKNERQKVVTKNNTRATRSKSYIGIKWMMPGDVLLEFRAWCWWMNQL